MRKRMRSGASGGVSTRANATSTSVESWPSAFSQKLPKSCRPTKRSAAARID